MPSYSFLTLLLLTLVMVAATTTIGSSSISSNYLTTGAQAADDDDDDDDEFVQDEEVEEDDELFSGSGAALRGIESRVLFTDAESSATMISNNGAALRQTPAGSAVHSYVTFQNRPGNPTFSVLLVTGHLAVLGSGGAVPIQNFSAIHTPRPVPAASSITVRYDFRPDDHLDPKDYHLVLRTIFADGENNTYASTAYNTTVEVTESQATDYQAIVSTTLLFGAIGAAVYFIMPKKEPAPGLQSSSSSGSFSSSSSKRGDIAPPSPTSPGGKSSPTSPSSKEYNADYISNEHRIYREAILKQKQQQQQSGRSASK